MTETQTETVKILNEPFTPEEIEQIDDLAYKAFSKWCRGGPRGQLVVPADGIEFHVMNATRRVLLQRLETHD